MKAEINLEGVLTISAENGLEGYALYHWLKENSELMSGLSIIFDPTVNVERFVNKE